MGGPDPGRQERTSFTKRTTTLLRKSHELVTLCGAKVYLIIDHPRASLAYNSVEEEGRQWPPPDELLVKRILSPKSNHFLADRVPGTPLSSPATNSMFHHESYACGCR